MDNLVFISIEGVLIAGQTESGPQNHLTLVKPRRVVMVNLDNGLVGVQFPPLLGMPESLTARNWSMMHNVTDEALINAYREAITGLTLARELPANVKRMGGN